MVGKYLLSVPGAGQFISSQTLGRKALLRVIKSTRFKEIQETELWRRKMPLESRFDSRYFALDAVGSQEVRCLETPTGRLFRCE